MQMLIKLVSICCAFILFGCSSVSLEPADFGWPVESVLEINEAGIIEDPRYSFTVNVAPMFYAENEDSIMDRTYPVRIIRDTKGYYFLTAQNFKNVHVFFIVDGSLILENSILIDAFGIDPVNWESSP